MYPDILAGLQLSLKNSMDCL